MTLDPVVVFAAITTVLTAVIGTGIRKVWVWGWVLADMESERDFWRDTALKAMGHTDKAITVAEKATGG